MKSMIDLRLSSCDFLNAVVDVFQAFVRIVELRLQIGEYVQHFCGHNCNLLNAINVNCSANKNYENKRIAMHARQSVTISYTVNAHITALIIANKVFDCRH